MFQNKNYGGARHEFADFVKMEEDAYSDRSTKADFYMAWCSIELFRPEAEEEMKAFIRKHPESNLKQAAFFQLGRQQYRSKKYKDALEWLKQVDIYALDSDQRTEYQFKMGYSYFVEKKYEEARKFFFEIIEVSGEYNAPANYYYAHIAYLNENYQTALNGFEKLIKNKTFQPIVPYYITQIYYLQEKYTKVIEYAPQFLEDASVTRSDEIAKMIGLSHYQLKEYQKAIPFLDKGTKSFSREDRFAYGYCLYKQKKFGEAVEQFEKVGGENDELLMVANYCLADCSLQLGDKQGAKVAFASTARMDFDKNMQQDALFNFAKLTYELSYSPFNETIKAFDEYLQKYPDSDRNDEAYDYLVKVYMTTKNYGDALLSMDKIAKKTPEIKKAYQRVSWLRGLELMKQLNYSKAIDSFNAALEYKIYNSQIAAECIYWKAEANYRMGDFTKATALYNEFLSSPGSGASEYYERAYYNIAYAYFEQDKYNEASDWFRKFVNQYNEKSNYVSDACNRIGDCFFLNRDYKNAAEYYRKSVNTSKWDNDYALYQQALSVGLLGDSAEKSRLLQQIRTSHPDSEYLDDALYELANAKVKLDDQTTAVSIYKELVSKFPNGSYAPKSLLQLGQLNYNAKEYQKAIAAYKEVVIKYPQSEEKKSAFMGLKNVYVDMNNVNDYFAFAESVNEGGGIRTSEKDSLSYISAERLYMSGETEKGTNALGDYLMNFPNGMFQLNAQFYKADAALNQQKFDEALAGFEQVLSRPNNLFTERALLASSQLNYRNKNYTQAKKQFSRLAQMAEIPENVKLAKVGYMRAVYSLKEYQNTIQAVGDVLELPKLQEELIREAKYKRGKSYFNLANTTAAVTDFKEVAKETKTAEGAEAKYLMAKIYLEKGQYDMAEKEINEFIEMNSPHHYWLAESFLLLSDVFLKKNDPFQARYTLQSIVDNYAVKNDGIMERAQAKLDVLLAGEKKAQEKIVNKEVKVQFEGADSTESNKLFEKSSEKSDSLQMDEERIMLEKMLNRLDIK
ncbi:tetratricopeptide repeat protein [Labilibaculum filiforme]|nr:tetratricopeptide repeat protein [Labilibaculum filiforme]